MLAGVAGGVAETLDADPSIVRIVWALLAILTGGVAFIVYIVMAIVVPEEPDDVDLPAGAPDTGSAAPDASDATPPPPPAPPTRAAERATRRAARRARRREAVDSGGAALIFGVLLIVIGGFFLLHQFLPWFGFHLWWPIAIVTLGILLILVSVRPSRPKE
jgi:phage shock protein C